MDWDDLKCYFAIVLLIILTILTISLPSIWYQKYEIDKKKQK